MSVCVLQIAEVCFYAIKISTAQCQLAVPMFQRQAGSASYALHQAHMSILSLSLSSVPTHAKVPSGRADNNAHLDEQVVLNEVVIDRGVSPFLCNLECFCDGNFVTHVQGDGLIVSTPTGSTAYNLAAGGSMVHPQVWIACCPHTLPSLGLVQQMSCSPACLADHLPSFGLVKQLLSLLSSDLIVPFGVLLSACIVFLVICLWPNFAFFVPLLSYLVFLDVMTAMSAVVLQMQHVLNLFEMRC